MIKWFCDLCENEIKKPENPVLVNADRCGKNREHADIYYGESTDILKICAHKKCADTLESELKGAVDAAKRVIKNNA